jgi:(E)-4-hydroxy-3-methylbut-2-enyl-diphosphate synthase
MGILLAGGGGDTIGASLVGDPVEEVRVALEILRTLELVPRGPRVIACPTCGRTRIDLEPLAAEVERRLEELGLDVEVAVIGCVVNGPGEARKADYGIAGGEGEGVIFAAGRPVRKVPQDRLVDELFAYIEAGAGRDGARPERGTGTE